MLRGILLELWQLDKMRTPHVCMIWRQMQEETNEATELNRDSNSLVRSHRRQADVSIGMSRSKRRWYCTVDGMLVALCNTKSQSASFPIGATCNGVFRFFHLCFPHHVVSRFPCRPNSAQSHLPFGRSGGSPCNSTMKSRPAAYGSKDPEQAQFNLAYAYACQPGQRNRS